MRTTLLVRGVVVREAVPWEDGGGVDGVAPERAALSVAAIPVWRAWDMSNSKEWKSE